MERGLLLPSIQIVNPATGTEVSYKVQYAPIYTGKAKSRPLSAYEEAIIKKALRSHSENDDPAAAAAVHSEHVVVEGRAMDAASIDVFKFDTGSFSVSVGDIADSSRPSDDSFGRPLGTAPVNTQRAAPILLGKRQHQVPSTIFTSTGPGSDRSTVSNRNAGVGNAGSQTSAPPSVLGKEASHRDSSVNSKGFSRPPVLDCLDEDFEESEDFIKLKLRHLKEVGNSKQQELRKAAIYNDAGQRPASSLPMQSSVVRLPVQRKATTQKEQTVELKRYQRRIVYMLNRVMTDAEAKQFEHFITVNGLRPKEYPYE